MSSSTVPIVQPKNPEVPRSVIFKVYLHTLLMVVLPISTYFYTSKYFFEDYGTTKAALFAAGIANVVVFSFIITAFMEDSGDKHQKRDKED
ncbi:14281_t:CDS:2 [Cetraspora pellucida]|uniref:14281_t:CDS:1 n=1 Tax=Cetraspora pellucida TaxID=1433469 RepID=A0A9N9A808_9GLOM|nr:14281_t:CDS:2 [Cetraspora pellucida]